MKILVTGGLGFIGSNFVNQFFTKHDIVILDNLSTGKLQNLSPNALEKVEIVIAGLNEYDKVDQLFKQHQFDAILHLAAVASVQKCLSFPRETYAINVEGSLNLLQLSMESQVKRFLFASSAAVYSDNGELPKRESSSLLAPISLYGVHKLAIEQFLRVCSLMGKIKGTSFRFFNVFGPNQDPHSPYSGVLSLFLSEVVHQSLPQLTLFGTGKQTRDFVSVWDVVQILEKALEDERMNGEIFNIGTGQETSLLEVIQLLKEISGKKIQIHYKDKRMGDIDRSVCERKKLEEVGLSPRISLREGLVELYYHFMQAENIGQPFSLNHHSIPGKKGAASPI